MLHWVCTKWPRFHTTHIINRFLQWWKRRWQFNPKNNHLQQKLKETRPRHHGSSPLSISARQLKPPWNWAANAPWEVSMDSKGRCWSCVKIHHLDPYPPYPCVWNHVIHLQYGGISRKLVFHLGVGDNPLNTKQDPPTRSPTAMTEQKSNPIPHFRRLKPQLFMFKSIYPSVNKHRCGKWSIYVWIMYWNGDFPHIC